MKKAMFVDIKIGDKVWDICEGWGVVSELLESHDYPICVEFEYVDSTYTWDGYYDLKHVNPSLFWDEVEFTIPSKPITTRVVCGVEIPDLSYSPEIGDYVYTPNPCSAELSHKLSYLQIPVGWAKLGLCYPHSFEGRQVAIAHSKAMIGVDIRPVVVIDVDGFSGKDRNRTSRAFFDMGFTWSYGVTDPTHVPVGGTVFTNSYDGIIPSADRLHTTLRGTKSTHTLEELLTLARIFRKNKAS